MVPRHRDAKFIRDTIHLVRFSPSHLLHLHDTPQRTAAAFALGVFFSFSPFIGLQVIVAMSLAFLLGLNRVAVFAGLNANLPWIIVPWYAGTTTAAAWAMGIRVPADFRRELAETFSLGVFSKAFWLQFASVLRPYLPAFLIGSTVGAAVVGLVAYPAVYTVLRRRSDPVE